MKLACKGVNREWALKLDKMFGFITSKSHGLKQFTYPESQSPELKNEEKRTMCRVIMKIWGYVFEMLKIVSSAKQMVAEILIIYVLNSYIFNRWSSS